MFVAVIQFPALKNDADFREWFDWSNAELAKHAGFVRRKLLRPREGGSYVGILEFESFAAFQAMHASPEHSRIHARVAPLFAGPPSSVFYDVVAG